MIKSIAPGFRKLSNIQRNLKTLAQDLHRFQSKHERQAYTYNTRSYQQLLWCDGVVRVKTEFFGGDGPGRYQFGRQENADGTKKLQTRLFGWHGRKKSVQVIDSQRENFFLTLLFFTNLWKQGTQCLSKLTETLIHFHQLCVGLLQNPPQWKT